ncbi:MAG: hypothetical protein Q8R24_03940 [Legionellaceae bacterium]|nr:hypothetical protein [Legionellaceae bacterium]
MSSYETDKLIKQLEARLPELEWKLGAIGAYISPKLLPKGLFRDRFELTPQICVDEIKSDLRVLKTKDNDQSAHYLASRVNQKINVLVRLCKTQPVKSSQKATTPLNLQAMSTRQRWLQTVQEDISRLERQRDALLLSVSTMESRHDVQASLTLQIELGEVERRLTMAVEARSKVQLNIAV